MTRIRYAAPHTIDPSLVEIGDDILVEYSPSKGVTTYHRGIVAKSNYNGDTRSFITADGGTIAVWSPRDRRKLKILLYSRLEQTQESLFDFLPEETKERIGA